MNAAAPIKRDQYALTDAEAQAILLAALRLSKSPRRNSLAYLELIEAVDAADGQDALAEQIADWREYHGLDRGECLACGEDCQGFCDVQFEQMREGRAGVWL